MKWFNINLFNAERNSAIIFIPSEWRYSLSSSVTCTPSVEWR
jgi:hypothetical protein